MPEFFWLEMQSVVLTTKKHMESLARIYIPQLDMLKIIKNVPGE